MSGIAGILRLDGGAPDENDLRAMADAMAHRGPDGAATLRAGPLGLVHVRLAVDDEPAQPLRRGASVLAMDGRIDNAALLSKIARRDASELSGPEAVLAAHQKRGARALPLILGDWALALWDGRALLLARDPIGLRPLFYHQDEARLIFASEIKALLALPGVPRRPDEETLAEFDRFRFRSMERTFFAGIRRLPPGEALLFAAGAPRRWTFWAPNPKRRIVLPDREAYRARFRSLFVEAVRCRLPRRGKAAIRLSGGLDSSAVAGAAALVREERPGLTLTTSSITSERSPETDERRHSGAVCAAFGLDNRLIFAERLDLRDGLKAAVRQQESALFEPIDVWVLRQFELAREEGAKIVLGGDWGDQVMGGCGYLADLLRGGRWLAFWRELRLYHRAECGSYRHLLKETFWYLVLPARICDKYEGLRLLARRLALPWRSVAPDGPVFPLAAKRQQYDAVFGIHNVLMLELLDKQGAQHGVEARLPFVDRRLVAFMLAIPSEEITRDGLTRRLEREALGGILLESIAARRDKGDCTDLELDCLRRAGFAGATPAEASRAWRRAVKEIWRSTWTSPKKRPSRRSTMPPALSSTAT